METHDLPTLILKSGGVVIPQPQIDPCGWSYPCTTSWLSSIVAICCFFGLTAWILT